MDAAQGTSQVTTQVTTPVTTPVPTQVTASPRLRISFLLVAAAMLGLWGLSLVPPIQNWNNPNEDGFSYVGVFYATPICLPTGLLLLAGGIAGRGKHLKRARTALFIGAGVLFIVVAFLIFQFVADTFPGLGLG
jgi:hypothetical protein